MLNFQTVADAFQMSDEVWSRHANPWSVWTRYLGLPLLVLAVWSRTWLGWIAIAPVIAVIVWIWVNPRVFPKPKTTRNWASKAVFGERVWLNRQQIPIPEHHNPIINFTNSLNAIGFILCSWGMVNLAIWPVICGLSWVVLGKTWFLDRMVWLYEEMKDSQPQYQNWLY